LKYAFNFKSEFFALLRPSFYLFRRHIFCPVLGHGQTAEKGFFCADDRRKSIE